MKKKILFIVFSSLKHDARVMRHINFLKAGFWLTVICLDSNPSNEYEIIHLPNHKLSTFRKALSGILLLLRLYTLAYKVLYPYHAVRERLISVQYDLILANDVETLPLAFSIANKKSKVILDAHEYAPRHFENVFTWRLFFQPFNIYLCKKYFPQLNNMITVGKKIAEEYEKHFDIQPTIITNAPSKQLLSPSHTNSVIRLVHHGLGTPSRQIELMIEMMKHLPDHFQLDLILLTPASASAQTIAYMDKLKTLSNFTDRIKFIPPLPIEKIVPFLNIYDLGIILIPPVNFNYENTLPNKFFDFIQARIALAIGPTPELAAIVNEYNIGVVSPDFTSLSLAKLIASLTSEQIQQYKKNTAVAANEFCAEKNKEILLSLVGAALEN
jgi:glycosyltransferase involved in cell wall biosynthesis